MENVPPSHGNARAADRRAVGFKAHLRESGGSRLDVDVQDLSRTGFRIDSVYGIAVGRRVHLTIPSFAPLEAEVAWREKSAYGCRFLQPLHPAVFDTIVARHQIG